MNIGIIGNTSKPSALEIIGEFAEVLIKHNVSCIYDSNLVGCLELPAGAKTAPALELGELCSVVISFGGDGTFLSTARVVGASGTPILGVNVGTLGFLTEIVVHELEETVIALIENRYRITERMVLNIKIGDGEDALDCYALNDVVVDRGSGSRLIDIDAQVDNVFLNSYRADGLIVATPTGSTAYSLSVGGPLVVPDLHAFIVSPICPHSLNVRPIVLGKDSVITLSIRQEGEPAQVNIDGQSRYKMMAHEKMIIRRANYNIRMISTGKRDFFNLLRAKLFWGAENKRENKSGALLRGE